MADVTEAAVRLVVDERGFDSAFTASVNRAARTAGVGMDKEMRGTGRAAGENAGREFGDGFIRGSDGRLRDSRGRFVSVSAEARVAGDNSGRTFGDAFRTALAIDLSGKLLSTFSAPLKGLSLAGLGAGAASAAASLVQFTAALAPAAGILAGFPATVGIAGAAFATLKVGVAGVGDAFAAGLEGDAEAFEEALEGLAPAAADTARAFAALKPQFDELKQAVQGELFAGLDEELTSVATTLLGPVQTGMSSAAASTNGLIVALSQVAQSAASVTFVEQSFAQLSTLIDNIRAPLADLVAAFFNVGNAAMASFDGLGSGLGGAIQSFADFLNEAAASGQVVEWISGAVTVFQQLGAILAPIGSIIASIGQAASQTGGDILGVLGQLLQGVADFLNTATGQHALIELFTTLGVLGDALLPILTAAGAAIAGILPSISGILQALAPAVEILVEGLGAGLQALAPALVPLAGAIGNIVTALTPLLPVVGQILGLVATVAADLLSALSPLISALVDALLPLLQALMPVIEQVADILISALTPVFAVLADVIATIAPFLVQIVDILAAAFLPLIEQWGTLLQELLPPLGELITALIEALMPIIIALLPVILELSTLFSASLADSLIELMPLIVSLITLITNILVAITPVIAAVATLTGWLTGGLVNGISTAIGWIADLAGWFAEIGAAVADSIDTAVGWISDFASDVADYFGDIGDWIDDLVGWFAELPGRVLDAIGDLGSQIWDSITGGLGDLGGLIGLADGGIITRATPAVVGEAGAEAVIPLTRPARALQLMRQSGLDRLAIANARAGDDSQRPIVVNVHTTTLSPKIVEAKVESALERALVGAGV